MEYYNKCNTAYVNALKRPLRKMKLKMELLDYYEKAIGQITNYLSSDSGSITVNRSQGCRRTCSISVIDKNREFIPQSDSPFWYNRKFKLYFGLEVGEDIYWFSQGVFVAQTVSAQGRLISVEGVDKFGFLDGELHTCMCDTEYQATVGYSKKGTKIVNLIRDTLLLEMGNGVPIDPVEPIIDPMFYNEILYNDIVIEEGNYIGDIFTDLAEMYGAYIYYDVDGHLRMERDFCYDRAWGYTFKASEFNFGETLLSEDDLNIQYNYDGCNIVTVATDNQEGQIYSYTAKNECPMSPININAIGARRYSDGCYYIPLSYTDDKEMVEHCRQQAQYLLMENICDNISISFSFPIVPHIDADDIITYRANPYIVQSLEISLDTGITSYEVANIQYLSYDSLTLEPKKIEYQFYRLVITKLRGSTSKTMQMRQIMLKDFNDNVYTPNAVTCNTKATSKEKVIQNIISADKGDCAVEFNGNIKIDFFFPDKFALHSFCYMTAEDKSECDPVSWKLYASNNHTNWHLINTTDNAKITTTRKTTTSDFGTTL